MTTPTAPRIGLAEDGVQAHGKARRKRRKALQGEQDAWDERFPRKRVVADREELTVAAEEHLLVGDEPR